MRIQLEKMLVGMIDLHTPDGNIVRMGDSSSVPQSIVVLNGCLKLFAPYTENPRIRRFIEKQTVEAGAVLYPESGLCIFRNAEPEQSMLFVDFSDNLKVHGHYDLGSWQFFQGKCAWVTEGGGPYKYGSAQRRYLMSSEAHNLVTPDGIKQSSGMASDVRLDEDADRWILSFNTNVYGADYVHTRTFTVLKDLSAFSVNDHFSLAGESPRRDISLRSRTILDPNELFRVDEVAGALQIKHKDGATLYYRVIPARAKTVVTEVQITEKNNGLTTTKALESSLSGCAPQDLQIQIATAPEAWQRLSEKQSPGADGEGKKMVHP